MENKYLFARRLRSLSNRTPRLSHNGKLAHHGDHSTPMAISFGQP
jgi:hypothetical protein